MSSSGSESTPVLPATRPVDLREARDAMADTAGAGLRVLLRGAGTAQSWGGPVRDAAAIIDTTGLDQILAYNPADMTVAVGAGIALRDLQAKLDGQRVALDAARVPEGATVGGLLATGDAGPLRATYGTLRDLVIGVTVVLADGIVARSGGHVIKNVAGYDLAKVLSGSLGTLGLVVEVVLRVHPLPEATGTLAVVCDVPTAFTCASGLLASPLEPVAVEWYAGRLLVRFEGTRAGVTTRLGKATDLVREDSGLAQGSADVLDGAGESAAWDEIADVVRGAPGDTVLRVGSRASDLPDLAARLDALATDHDIDATLTSSVGIGVHTVRIRGDEAAAHAAVVAAWRSAVLERGGSVTLHRRIAGLDDLVPSWGPAPATLPLLRALKTQLDRDNRLGPGRFAPWY
ncbi:FAD-binding oxidoreductase [Actinopolymorpha sp. B11F2]|uniref:FAD-binding oxidoreductase n=1 Tax=Actinopolymorpha sp. B11F2 TaxID=3160862 RepID=UPI0032E3757D